MKRFAIIGRPERVIYEVADNYGIIEREDLSVLAVVEAENEEEALDKFAEENEEFADYVHDVWEIKGGSNEK